MRRSRLVGPVAQRRFAAQHRDGGVGHGQRATGAGFDLVVQVAERGAGHVGAGAGAGPVPGQAGHAMRLGQFHQPVVGRVEFHRVDALAVAVMRAQARPIAIGVEAQPVQLVASQARIALQAIAVSVGATAGHPLAQGDVIGPQVARLERRRHRAHAMGLERRQVLRGWFGHGVPPPGAAGGFDAAAAVS